MPKKSYALLSMTLASALALSTVGVAGAAASECGTSTTSTASVKAKTAKAATTTASSQQSAEKANQKKLAENKQFVLNMFKDISPIISWTQQASISLMTISSIIRLQVTDVRHL